MTIYLRGTAMSSKEVLRGDMGSREDQAVDQHRVRLDQLQARWDVELRNVAASFGIEGEGLSTGEIMQQLERVTCGDFVSSPEHASDKGMVIGCAGPGASGKGTLDKHMMGSHGFTKVINTTTRAMRHYERDGVEYHFVDEDEYQRRLDAGMLIGANDKPGRGRYGIGKTDLETGVQTGGCLVEESPANLLNALQETSGEATTMLLYILPPDPIMDTCARRLYGRSSENEDDRELTESDVESTLGDRQIDEFSVLATHAQYPGVRVVFVINDDLKESQAKLDALLSK
jgi:guanylate kinase